MLFNSDLLIKNKNVPDFCENVFCLRITATLLNLIKFYNFKRTVHILYIYIRIAFDARCINASLIEIFIRGRWSGKKRARKTL